MPNKAEATVTCTSANADKIVKQLGSKQVIFGPDENLGYFVQRRVPDVELIIVPEDGHCYVHRFIGRGDEALELKKDYPGSEVWAHPECEPEFQDRADFVLSTGGMVKRTLQTPMLLLWVLRRGLLIGFRGSILRNFFFQRRNIWSVVLRRGSL